MSVLSDLYTLILRTVSASPLTTKGSQLTWDELDENFTKIFFAMGEILNGANVTAYDAGATYDANSENPVQKYVSYGSKIWEAVYTGSPSSFTGQTPSEGTYWTQTTLAQMLGNPNALTKIAEAFDETLNPSQLYETEWQSSTVKTLTTPIDVTDLPAPGATKIIVPEFLVFALDAGAVVYNFPVGGLRLNYFGFSDTIINISQSIINSASDVYAIFKVQDAAPLKVNTKMQLSSGSDATTGNGTYHFKVIYSIKTAPF
jgi:hypothetical protein